MGDVHPAVKSVSITDDDGNPIVDDEVAPVVDESDDPKTKVVATNSDFDQLFSALTPKQRADVLLAMMSRYCPECGEDHQKCKCELRTMADIDLEEPVG